MEMEGNDNIKHIPSMYARESTRRHALEQLIKDIDAMMQDDFPFYWQNDVRAMQIRERMQRLGIRTKQQQKEYEDEEEAALKREREYQTALREGGYYQCFPEREENVQ